MTEPMLLSLLNSENTVAVVRLPVYWKYTQSMRFAAIMMAFTVRNTHLAAFCHAFVSFRCSGKSIIRAYKALV